ncbi:MAG: hypothetical protein ABIG40_02755 [Parcubacteria group bacterium]
MAEEKCACGMPLNNEADGCSCKENTCYHCCSCAEDCSCGCKKK